MRRSLIATLLSAILAVACSPPPSEEPAADEPAGPTSTTSAPPDAIPSEADTSSRSAEEIQANNEAILARLREAQEVAQQESETSGTRTDSAESSLEEVLAEALAGVVSIEAGSSLGSGFFISPSVVVTNLHVVGNRRLVKVVRDEDRRDARVLKSAPRHDLALLELYDADPGQTCLELGSINDIVVGQDVVAIGSAYSLEATVTRGIVSAIRTAGDVTFVQTDAAINPGNSGGPLLSTNGKVIGINAAKFAGAESLGLAIAADHVRALHENEGPMQPLPAAEETRDDHFEELIDPEGSNSAPERRPTPTETPLERFERDIQRLAREADAVDATYPRVKRECRVEINEYSSTTRATITLAMAGVAAISSRSGCTARFEELRKKAVSITNRVRSLSQRAEREGVRSNTIDYVRRSYSLSW